jgi:hypothetical protein
MGVQQELRVSLDESSQQLLAWLKAQGGFENDARVIQEPSTAYAGSSR